MCTPHILHLQSKHSKNPGNQTLWILLEVVREFRQQLEVQTKLILAHGLDDELVVMAEEEEASTATSTLARFDQVLNIMSRC